MRPQLLWLLLINIFCLNSYALANKNDFPGTEAGAKALLQQFVEPGANIDALSAKLQPSEADYKAYFVGNDAAKANKIYSMIWDKGYIKIKPKPGQTKVLLYKTTSDGIKEWTGVAKEEFPGGYRSISDKLKNGLTIYKFRFVKPGENYGMAFDGLTYINGHWVIFPKPYRVLK